MIKIKNLPILLGVAAFLLIYASGCGRDTRESLFIMPYSNIQFDIPGGLSASLPRALVLRSQPTRIDQFTTNAGRDASTFSTIRPISARLQSLNGLDYDYISAISLRVCPEGQGDCPITEEVFYIDDLHNRRVGDRIDLIPTLRNAYSTMTNEVFRLEIIFFFEFNTPYTVPSRLDVVFDAVE